MKYEAEVFGGIQFWCLNGVFHREDGPAVIFADGTQAWYLHGELVTEEEHSRLTTPERD